MVGWLQSRLAAWSALSALPAMLSTRRDSINAYRSVTERPGLARVAAAGTLCCCSGQTLAPLTGVCLLADRMIAHPVSRDQSRVAQFVACLNRKGIQGRLSVTGCLFWRIYWHSMHSIELLCISAANNPAALPLLLIMSSFECMQLAHTLPAWQACAKKRYLLLADAGRAAIWACMDRCPCSTAASCLSELWVFAASEMSIKS